MIQYKKTFATGWQLSLKPWSSAGERMLFNFQENIGTPLCSLSLAFKKQCSGTSLVAQWLGLGISAAGDLGSVPDWGTKIL